MTSLCQTISQPVTPGTIHSKTALPFSGTVWNGGVTIGRGGVPASTVKDDSSVAISFVVVPVQRYCPASSGFTESMIS
uniref:Uncharacterized protein n=1 Tax=Panagrolaimus davidi TaxID=227884 RepID=A0A914QS44_9BILA